MPNPKLVTTRLLELLMKRATIGQLPIGPNLLKIRLKLLQGRKIRACHVDWFIPHWKLSRCSPVFDEAYLLRLIFAVAYHPTAGTSAVLSALKPGRSEKS